VTSKLIFLIEKFNTPKRFLEYNIPKTQRCRIRSAF